MAQSLVMHSSVRADPMKITVNNLANAGNNRLTFPCPHCGSTAVFEPFHNIHDLGVTKDGILVGHRKCPNTDCLGHVFVILKGQTLLESYPPTRLDFKSDGIPQSIVDSLEEAITCEANECYAAAAIMVRRTLEEICAAQGATGGNLKERLKDLNTKIVVPDDLKEAMDDLRLLGNDAAHIEATVYNNVSSDEIEVAVEFTKELLKALYQYKSLLARLKGLKKTPAP